MLSVIPCQEADLLLRFEVFTVLKIQVEVIWVVAPCIVFW